MIDGIEIETSSGNVFADLGLPDAEKLKIKSGLVFEIRKAMRNLDLTQQAAAKRMGIPNRPSRHDPHNAGSADSA